MAAADRKDSEETAPALGLALEVWEQQHGESPQAYDAFKHYRDSDPITRGLRATAQAIGRSFSTISNYSSAHGWVTRTHAFDVHNERIRMAELREDGIKASKRHATTAQMHIMGLGKLTQELLERIERDPAMLTRLTDKILIQLATSAARATPRLIVAERLALGLSSENVGGHDGGPLGDPNTAAANMDDQELDTFLLGAAAMAKAHAEQQEAKAAAE